LVLYNLPPPPADGDPPTAGSPGPRAGPPPPRLRCATAGPTRTGRWLTRLSRCSARRWCVEWPVCRPVGREVRGEGVETTRSPAPRRAGAVGRRPGRRAPRRARPGYAPLVTAASAGRCGEDPARRQPILRAEKRAGDPILKTGRRPSENRKCIAILATTATSRQAPRSYPTAGGWSNA
jgi:hypothetical protein